MSIGPRVAEISVNGFKGIRDLILPLRGRSLMMVGENGTGKSSIIDAIEYGLRGGGGEGSVRVGFMGHSDQVHNMGDGTSYPRPLEDVREAISSCKFILRRDEISDFVRASDDRRCYNLSGLMGLQTMANARLCMMGTDSTYTRMREWVAARDIVMPHELERESSLSKRLLDEYSGSLLGTIGNVLDRIRPHVARYYTFLHPEVDGVTDLIGSLRPGTMGLRMSEGHMDSLAICVFLAYYRCYAEDCPLLILDDVMTSVDSAHRARISELLTTEFSDRQSVITTHDRIWFEQMKGAQRANSVDGEYLNVILLRWDPNIGPRLSFPRDNRGRVVSLLEEGDVMAAGNALRHYLEWVLENVCRNMEVKLRYQGPTSIPRYSLEEMLSSVRSRMSSMMPKDVYEDSILPAIRSIESKRMMGNLLSHSNIDAYSISTREVLDFLDGVERLRDAFSCPACGRFLRYDRTIGIIYCPWNGCPEPTLMRLR